MNPPSTVLGGGVHGKVCWLIAYMYAKLPLQKYYFRNNCGQHPVYLDNYATYRYEKLHTNKKNGFFLDMQLDFLCYRFENNYRLNVTTS